MSRCGCLAVGPMAGAQWSQESRFHWWNSLLLRSLGCCSRHPPQGKQFLQFFFLWSRSRSKSNPCIFSQGGQLHVVSREPFLPSHKHRRGGLDHDALFVSYSTPQTHPTLTHHNITSPFFSHTPIPTLVLALNSRTVAQHPSSSSNIVHPFFATAKGHEQRN